LAVGDVFFRQKCYARLEQLRSSGAAILLVSHSIPEIEQYCERAILLDHGVRKFIGPSSEAAKHYYLLHQQPQVEEMGRDAIVSPNSSSQDGSFIDPLPQEAFIDLTNKPQIGNGQARCTVVALCNGAGHSCSSFRQGDLAVFYYEFELADDIGIPICGVVIKNDRGVIVHGKNSWQCENDVPASQGAGSRIRCWQEIKLDIAPGEYLFEIGLSSVSPMTWAQRERVSHEEMTVKRTRICHVDNIASFSVGFSMSRGVVVLNHHGVADLPGNIVVRVS
jgi:lipopolysaccharide transport system ATP-binding protein